MPDPNRPLLNPERLLHGWTPRRIGRRVLTLAETDSTNSVALSAVTDPETDGLAVFADYQSAGRGRQGRAWLAPRGASVLCSVLLLHERTRVREDQEPRASAGSVMARETSHPIAQRRSMPTRTPRVAGEPPPQAWPTTENAEGGTSESGGSGTAGRLTLASAVAVCEAIRSSTDVSPAIKWPNDIRVGGRKLAGILIESRAIEEGLRAWVIGIGINCCQQAGHFPPELRDSATSLDILSAAPIDREAVARALLKALDERLAGEPSEDRGATLAHWLAYAEPLGQRVRLRSGGRDYVGRTLEVDPAGGLVLQCDDGHRRWFDPLLTSMV